MNTSEEGNFSITGFPKVMHLNEVFVGIGVVPYRRALGIRDGSELLMKIPLMIIFLCPYFLPELHATMNPPLPCFSFEFFF